MEKLVTIRTLTEMNDLMAYVESKKDDFIAFDTETNGVSRESRIIGFSICADLELAYYVILAEWSVEKKQLIWLPTAAKAKEFMQCLVGKQLVMHNATFDCSMVQNNYQVSLIDSVHTDTMILGHVLDENRPNGLKDRAVELFGEDSKAEQVAMKESIARNGGNLTKGNYELYKADADLIAHYGAKDALLTLKIFNHDVPELFDQKLDTFFYEEESMPLLRGPTYEMNTTGLRIDPEKLKNLKAQLEADCVEAMTFIQQEIWEYVRDKYPGTGKTNHFNIDSTQQLSWLLFDKLQNDFNLLTSQGKEVCKFLNLPLPYSASAKRNFIQACRENKGVAWKPGYTNKKTGKEVKPKLIVEAYKYMACGKETLTKLSSKYKWVERYLEYKKNQKILNTYVIGIQEKMQYNIIRPNFLQHGTTSGRYSCKNPNFQNLPREDKRVKSCIISRQGKVFVGADYSQLEPRVFASLSGDERLIECFKSGQDFYSVIGANVFGKPEASLYKNDEDSFANLYPEERQISKTIALAATYGANAMRLSSLTKQSVEDTRMILEAYFNDFPSVKNMVLESHKMAKSNGYVSNLYGRPRRMPEAMQIEDFFGDAPTDTLPYEYRNLLNLSVNHRIQSSAASIMNRAAIAFCKKKREKAKIDARWNEVSVLMQVHDELVTEGPEEIKHEIVALLKESMENTVVLPRVALVAEPKIANDLASLK
jgi:DNA polymerase I-like protein with 3'-5' exonuclease and polymerase domains